MKTNLNEIGKSKTNSKTVILCPSCNKAMEVGFDKSGQDFYCQCRNKNCSFDGANANTLAELSALIAA